MNEQEIEVARQVSIYDILGLKSKHRRTSVKCVFHTDNTPSLAIYPTGGYHCFGCGKHGKNAIDFCMDLGLSFKEAVSQLKDY